MNSKTDFDKIRHPRKRAFLAAYAECGDIIQAAKIAKIHRSTHYKWLQNDFYYAQAAEVAFQLYIRRLEAEADRRALFGTRVPIHYKGKTIGYRVRYSDSLLAFRLKALCPEKYH